MWSKFILLNNVRKQNYLRKQTNKFNDPKDFECNDY